ncbi:MAG: sugar phosphate isomerase/epimerase [Clostridia bacterium]|nr:sugar phosphate isomerase/epimerase [Clostridia bacterium]
MKPALISAFFNELDSYEMAETFKKIGYDNIEISDVHFMPFYNKELDVKEYRKYIDALDFHIPQGHIFFMNKGDITSYDNTYAVDNIKKNLDVFYELGVKAAVIHYSNYGTDVEPVEKWFDVRIDALNRLIKHIEGTDMVICLENLSRIHDHDAGHLIKMCKAVDNPKHIGICLDTGHLNISQYGNQYDFIMQAGDYLKAMHVHDNRGEQHGLKGVLCDWHIMPFDSGNVNWADVKRGVKEANYQGLFSYEVAGDMPLEIKKLRAKYLLDCYNSYFAF